MSALHKGLHTCTGLWNLSYVCIHKSSDNFLHGRFLSLSSLARRAEPPCHKAVFPLSCDQCLNCFAGRMLLQDISFWPGPWQPLLSLQDSLGTCSHKIQPMINCYLWCLSDNFVCTTQNKARERVLPDVQTLLCSGGSISPAQGRGGNYPIYLRPN